MRLAKQIVFKAMTRLNSIGDYKHPDLERYRGAYEKTTSHLNALLHFLEIPESFSVEGLTSLYMPFQRVEGLVGTKVTSKLFLHRDAVSIV